MEARYNFGVERLQTAINETIRHSVDYRLEASKGNPGEFKVWFPRKGIYFRCRIESADEESILFVSAESSFSILTSEYELFWNTIFLQQVESSIHKLCIFDAGRGK